MMRRLRTSASALMLAATAMSGRAQDVSFDATVKMAKGGASVSGTLKVAGQTASGSVEGVVPSRPGTPARQGGGAVTGVFRIKIEYSGTYTDAPIGKLEGAATLSGTFEAQGGGSAVVTGEGRFTGSVSRELGMAEVRAEWPQASFQGAGLAPAQPFAFSVVFGCVPQPFREGGPTKPGTGVQEGPGPGVTTKPGADPTTSPGGAGTPGGTTKPGTGTTPAGPSSGSAAAAHLLTYTEISRFDDLVVVDNGIYPVISKDGSRVGISFAPDKADTEKKQRAGVIGTDGSGFRFVDATAPLTYSALFVDISADGKWLASTDSRQIRLAGTDGGGARRIFQVDGGIDSIRVSPDGGLVYFGQAAKSRITDTPQSVEWGIWCVRADGRGLRQVVNQADAARVIGVTPDKLGTLYSGSRGRALDISNDGKRLVFLIAKRGMSNPGYAMVVNSDGSELRRVFTASNGVASVGISGDGGTVGLVALLSEAPGYYGITVRADGSGERRFTSKGWAGGMVCLTQDGSRVVFGNEAVLYWTDGSGALPISTPADSLTGGRLGPEALMHLTMDSSGRAFTWVVWDSRSRYQIVRVDLDPADLGEAPRISDMVFPASVPPDGRTNATVSARLTTSKPIVRCLVTTCYLGARFDYTVGHATGLFDNGKEGDPSPGDNVFVASQFRASTSSQPGPRALRFWAETTDAEDRRRAIAVQVGSIFVGPK